MKELWHKILRNRPEFPYFFAFKFGQLRMQDHTRFAIYRSLVAGDESLADLVNDLVSRFLEIFQIVPRSK